MSAEASENLLGFVGKGRNGYCSLGEALGISHCPLQGTFQHVPAGQQRVA